MLTWSHYVKILCITPNISSQQIKMIKPGPCILNEVMLSHFHISCLYEILFTTPVIMLSWLKDKLSLKALTILHEVCGKRHSNSTNVGKWVTNWWKSSDQFKMVSNIIWCIIMFCVKCKENQDNLYVISKHVFKMSLFILN